MLTWSGRSGKLRSTIDEKMVPLIVMKGCQRIFCKQVGHINAVSVPYSLVKKKFIHFSCKFFSDFSMYFGWKNSRHIHYEKAQKVDWNYLNKYLFLLVSHVENSQCSRPNPHITDAAVSEREMPGSLFAR